MEARKDRLFWQQNLPQTYGLNNPTNAILELYLRVLDSSYFTCEPLNCETTDFNMAPLRFPEVTAVIGHDSGEKTDILQQSFNGMTELLQSRTESIVQPLRPADFPVHCNGSSYITARQAMVLKSSAARDTAATGKRKPPVFQSTPSEDFNFSVIRKSLGCFGRAWNQARKNESSPAFSCRKGDIPYHSCDASAVENSTAGDMLKNIDSKMVDMINNEIVHSFKTVEWTAIAGLEYAKSIIKEAVIYPLLRPDIFTGLRKPPRGILLFGPPGTGKTLIGKCIASQSSATFFSISSASLTSKWVGEGEKMVRALFAVAKMRQPSVIFIDEVDSLLTQRSDNENEGSRRLKTEFLVRLDGATTSDDDRVVIVGATNRPQELDEAVRRRFVKRLYVPLPDLEARKKILKNLLTTVDSNIDTEGFNTVAQLTDGYSGADMDSLCREASMEPLRSLPAESIMTFNKNTLRPINLQDYHKALRKIRPSVSQEDLEQYIKWNELYGCTC